MSATRPVTPRVLQDRLASLAGQLSGRDDALALLALGSVGTETDRLDEWSDLDFFVLVRDGAKERYIVNLDWLAAAHPLAWHFQNTADGHKALMTDGVFCEFAVFEVHELNRIPYARGRFIWRRDEVDEALASAKWPLPSRHDSGWLVGEALSNLIVGLLRHARGERLAAMRMVQVHCLDRVLEFLELLQPGSDTSTATRDPFNVDRRIEMRSSQAAQALPTWAGGYEGTVPAALALLAALEAHDVVPADVSEHIRMLATMANPLLPPVLDMEPSQTAGYSGTPLARKLGIREGTTVLLVGAPEDYVSSLEPLPPAVTFKAQADRRIDLAQVFVTRRDELARLLTSLRRKLRPDAAVWVSWPKKSARLATDVTEDTIRELALPLGFVDIKVCAVSNVWSGLKLVVRRELR